jgi:hypothetical protein
MPSRASTTAVDAQRHRATTTSPWNTWPFGKRMVERLLHTPSTGLINGNMAGLCTIAQIRALKVIPLRTEQHHKNKWK